MWASSVLKLYRKFFGSTANPERLQSGIEAVLDGNTAVAVTEACIAETAGLGGTLPADSAGRTWESEQTREDTNFFGHPLTSRNSGEPRGAIATAIGSSLSGLRATAFVSGHDLTQSLDLLRLAVGRHVPLIVQVGARAAEKHAIPSGSGHDGYHMASETGCFQLFARNVQQAVDFTLVARRTAELGLVPGIVAMDSGETAIAAQEVHLPPPELVKSFLGSPSETMATPTEAQKLLFGDKRRRIPMGYDLDRPVLLGGFQGPEAFALGVAGQTPFFNEHLLELIEASMVEFEKRTGRKQDLVSSHHTQNADWILVAQGSAVETAEAVADWLRKERKKTVGVVGIQCLRPFPAARILELVKGAKRIAVLERVDSPPGTEPPLLRELRSAVGKAIENGRFGKDTHPYYPDWREADCPRFHSVLYGLGSHPLRGADLAELCSELESKGQSQVYLGVEFAPESSSYPKRQVLLDQIRRAYPRVVELGMRSKEPSPDVRPRDSITISVHCASANSGNSGNSGQGSPGSSLANEAAALVHNIVGGHIRSRPDAAWERFGELQIDRFTYSSEPLKDPGDDLGDELAIVAAAPRDPSLDRALARLRKGGTVLVTTEAPDTPEDIEIPEPLWNQILRLEAKVFVVSSSSTDSEERLLGGLMGLLAERLGVKVRKIANTREEMLAHLADAERSARLAAFEAGLETLQEVRRSKTAEPSQPALPDQDVPMAVRLLGAPEATVDSLPRFWDQVGVLYRNNETENLTADPYQTTGAVPPLTSTFRDFSSSRTMLPNLDPGLCTGCGACWTWCPDGAIAPVAATPTALLESGVSMAGGADALRPVVSQLASRVTTEIKKADPAPKQTRQVLNEAFEWLLEKMPMPNERKQAVEEAFGKVCEYIGALPIAKTQVFFDEAETRAKGSGELLSLAVNPDACKGCGICIQVCEPDALTEKPQNDSRIREARKLWRLWEQLPDTAAETIERAREHPDVGPAAAMLLSRHCLMAISGGDGAEAGSGEKIALRLALAAVEHRQQPLVRQWVNRIDEAREKLAGRVRETLASALPTSDLDALGKGIDLLGNTAADLPSLMERVHGAIEHGRVDTKRLRREVEVAQKLGDIAWHLEKGLGAMGRSRMGIVVASDLRSSWLGSFPDNPFSVPVVVDRSGEAPQLAIGLVDGQIRTAMETLTALKKADLELAHPEEAERQGAELEPSRWRDLSKEERDVCPPLLLVGTSETLAGKGLFDLLETDLPIKVLVLSELSFGSDVDRGSKTHDVAFTALALRRAFVAQCSISEPGHFYACLRDSLDFSGPALIHVYAPSPTRNGYDAHRTVEQAQMAVHSRAFPIFRYDPTGEGVFGLHLDLEGNPAPGSTFVEDEELGRLTPAHWAAREKRFSELISPLGEDPGATIAVAEYLLLPEEQRSAKTPFVTIDGETRLGISAELVKSLDERVSIWRALQEVAGLVTPFTQKVREEAERAVAEIHKAETQSLRNEYEAKIQSLSAEKQSEIAEKIRNQLLVLTGYKK